MKTHLVFRQYVWLLETLRRYRKLSLEEINALWLRTDLSDGVSMARSSFNYHRRNIEEMFDINIECDSKDGYRYYIENGESLDANNVQNYLLETLSVSNALSQTKDIRNRIVLEKIPMGQ
ncbi:MAG: WYL domain-containing protein, partial [Bacteroidales bacterium]|nr:WYL domain-containing protein [Bacteroidales bacterium]